MLARAAVAGMTVVGALALMATPAQAAGTVKLLKTQYDSPGSDDRSNSSLNAEWMVVKNTNPEAVSLRGWTLRDASGHTYTFRSLTLGAGETVRVHTGSGRDTSSHVYWGSGNYVWNNTSDRAELRRPTGTLKDTCTWSTSDDGYVAC